MGSGGSRLNAEHEAVPTKLRPIFRRRVEEILRRRRSAAVKDGSCPSVKELLLEDKTENDENVSRLKSLDYNNDARKMVLSPEEDSVASCVTSEGSKRSSSKGADGGKEESAEAKRKGEKIGEVVAKVVAAAAAADVVAGGRDDGDHKEDEGEHNEEEEEEEEDHEGRLSDDERMICPGSPSFRVYFISNLDDDEDDNDNDGGKKDGPNPNDKTRSKERNTLVTSPRTDSVGKQKANKGRKRRSLKKVMLIPKGGQTAVKNLFNVRSCYTPSSSSHDRTHLLTNGKTPT